MDLDELRDILIVIFQNRSIKQEEFDVINANICSILCHFIDLFLAMIPLFVYYLENESYLSIILKVMCQFITSEHFMKRSCHEWLQEFIQTLMGQYPFPLVVRFIDIYYFRL